MNNRFCKPIASLAAILLLLAIVTASAQQKSDTQNYPWMNTSLSPDERAEMVLKQMTLDEKISLLHGNGMAHASQWQMPLTYLANGGAGYVEGVKRLGIPPIFMSDAAYGVRSSAENGRYSTALPSNLGSAASWDPQAACEYGALIGRELRAQGYNMTLGGGTNITREPRNGRTFEYMGEDPILAGTLVGNRIKCEQAQRSQRHHRQARAARDRSAGIRNWHQHRPSRGRDVFVQCRQRRFRVRKQVPSYGGTQTRLEVPWLRGLRLGRDPQHREGLRCGTGQRRAHGRLLWTKTKAGRGIGTGADGPDR